MRNAADGLVAEARPGATVAKTRAASTRSTVTTSTWRGLLPGAGGLVRSNHESTEPSASAAIDASMVADVVRGRAGRPGLFGGGRGRDPVPHGRSRQCLRCRRDRRVASGQYGGQFGGLSLGDPGGRHDLAVGIGHVGRQLDVDGAERCQQLRHPRFVRQFDDVKADTQCDRGLRLDELETRQCGRLGHRQTLVTVPARGVDADRRHHHVGPGPAGAGDDDRQRCGLSLGVDPDQQRRRRVGEGQLGRPRLDPVTGGRCPQGAATDDGQHDGGDQRDHGGAEGHRGRAPPPLGEGGHIDSRYRPRASITSSTGSVTR